MSGTDHAEGRQLLARGLLTDASLVEPPLRQVRGALDAWQALRDTPASDVTASLALPAGLAVEVLDAVAPDHDVPVVLASVGPGSGLAALAAARDVLLDQPWLRPVGAWLDVAPLDLPRAVSMTLHSLDLTVPAALFLPEEAGDQDLLAALDVIAADGAELAGWHADGDGRSTARFLRACHERRVRSVVTVPAERVLGLLNAAVTTVLGGSTADVTAALHAADLPSATPAVARAARALLTTVGVREWAAATATLAEHLEPLG